MLRFYGSASVCTPRTGANKECHHGVLPAYLEPEEMKQKLSICPTGQNFVIIPKIRNCSYALLEKDTRTKLYLLKIALNKVPVWFPVPTT